jgi:hypothetical protein
VREYNSDTYALWLAYAYRDTEPETIDISFIQKLAGVPDYSKNKRFEAYNRVFDKLGKKDEKRTINHRRLERFQ